jgi:hypothetical protein
MLRKLKIVVVTLVVGIAGLWIIVESPLNPAALQHRNLVLAEQHLKSHAAVLENDPRFRCVEVHLETARDGGIGISGYVASDADLTSLKAIWEQTKPPVVTYYSVEVLPEPYFSQEASGFRPKS